MSAAIDTLRHHVGAAAAAATALDAALVEAARAHKALIAELVHVRRAAREAGVRDVDAAAALERYGHAEVVAAVLAREGVSVPVAPAFSTGRYLGDLVREGLARLVKQARDRVAA